MIALYAAFYLMVSTYSFSGVAGYAIPYQSLSECQAAAEEVQEKSNMKAFCITGNKP